MYNFIRIQYMLGNWNANKVNNCVPKWLTQEQAEEIISLKQTE